MSSTAAPAAASATASVRRRDKTTLSFTAYGVSCRARAERLALRRPICGDSPPALDPQGHNLVPPLPHGFWRPCGTRRYVPFLERGTLADTAASSVPAR